jgi:hypothetical protein
MFSQICPSFRATLCSKLKVVAPFKDLTKIFRCLPSGDLWGDRAVNQSLWFADVLILQEVFFTLALNNSCW